eukprot:6458137-Amphidinium_carterae.1
MDRGKDPGRVEAKWSGNGALSTSSRHLAELHVLLLCLPAFTKNYLKFASRDITALVSKS